MIARQLAIACLIYLALVIQPSLGDGLGHSMFRPWLPGIVVVTCVWSLGRSSGLICSALLGLGIDCLSGGKLGIHFIVATIVAMSLMLLRTNARSPVVVIGMLAFFAAFTWRCMAAVAHASLGHQSFEVNQIIAPAATDGVSTSVLFIGVLLLYRVLITAFQPQPVSSVALTNRWSMLSGG
jgi:rod shape-determining protein MreD